MLCVVGEWVLIMEQGPGWLTAASLDGVELLGSVASLYALWPVGGAASLTTEYRSWLGGKKSIVVQKLLKFVVGSG